MNKYRLRAFSYGILLAIASIGLYIYFTDLDLNKKPIKKTDKDVVTFDEAKEIVLANGYTIITEDELKSFEKTEQELKSIQADIEKQAENNEQVEDKRVTTYILKIKSGMTSNDISKILAGEGIIDDANDFNDYLAINGYSKSLQLGSFELTDEMSFKDIATVLTE